MKIILLIASLLFMNTAIQDVDREFPLVSPDQVRLELALDPSAILIDTRVRYQYRRRRIENAVSLPGKAALDSFAEKTARHRPLYLYCAAEARSLQAAALLDKHGFLEIYVMEGGFGKWKAYNLPTVKGRKGKTVKQKQ